MSIRYSKRIIDRYPLVSVDLGSILWRATFFFLHFFPPPPGMGSVPGRGRFFPVTLFFLPLLETMLQTCPYSPMLYIFAIHDLHPIITSCQPEYFILLFNYKSYKISKVIVIYSYYKNTINTTVFVIMIQELKSRHDFPVFVIII